MARYRLDKEQSRFTVQAFVAGMLSFLGHNPLFNVKDFRGTVNFEDDDIGRMHLDLIVAAGSLAVTGEVKESDRREIETRMRNEVLETETYPEIRFVAAASVAERTGQGRYRVRLDGDLVLHGVTRSHRTDIALTIYDDGIRFEGDTPVRMSEHAIQPVTALGGTIRLKDDLRLAFELVGVPEAT